MVEDCLELKTSKLRKLISKIYTFQFTIYGFLSGRTRFETHEQRDIILVYNNIPGLLHLELDTEYIHFTVCWLTCRPNSFSIVQPFHAHYVASEKNVASCFWVYWLASERLWNKKLGKKIISVIFKLSTNVDSACWHTKKSKLNNFKNSPKTWIFLEFSWTKVMRMQTFTNLKAFCHFCEVFFSKDLALAFTFFYFWVHKF